MKINLTFGFACILACFSCGNGKVTTAGRVCGEFDVCNLIHKHYWGRTSVEQFCICPEGDDLFCEDDFRDDGRSLNVNLRTQMKFCEPLESLYYKFNSSDSSSCEGVNATLSVRTNYILDKVQGITATLHCAVPTEHPVYWRHLKHLQSGISHSEKLFESVDHFNHEILPKCNENEFCGYARADYGFLFQRCTCSIEHHCRYGLAGASAQIEDDVESELFFQKDFMFKSRCVKRESFEEW